MKWWTKPWNPVIGCTKCSPACANCYAEALHTQRHKALMKGMMLPDCYGLPFDEVCFLPERLEQPLHWRKPQRIFVGNMGDLFHEDVQDAWLDRIFAVMALCPQHTFMLCTKRPERMAEYLATPGRVRAICVSADNVASLAVPASSPSKKWIRFQRESGAGALTAWTYKGSGAEEFFLRQGGGEYPPWLNWPLPNVWLGTTIWDQASADRAVPILLSTPAAKRFVSVEPMLGPVDLTLDGLSCWPCLHCANGEYQEWDTGANACPKCDGTGKSDEVALDWVICGGETGPCARPMHPDWPRSLRDQCVAAGVPFFFKQWGEWEPRDTGRQLLDHVPQIRLTDAGENGGVLGASGKNDSWMQRSGTRRAGRVLDGRTWEEVPA